LRTKAVERAAFIPHVEDISVGVADTPWMIHDRSGYSGV
jgi:hypothetical protein